MLGKALAHYDIQEKLGAGGMGEVYRARDRRLSRDVALKVLPPDVASEPGRLARLEREAKALAALNHPHIVTIYSIEESDGVRFLTMELVDGRTLDRVVSRDGLPLAEALDLAISLTEALAAAHDKGITHRDLKPANVMVTPEGRLKVLDFGLAKPTTAGDALPAGSEFDATIEMSSPSPISSEGAVMGTVPYMAPEQLRGDVVDARADLFAFGIMLYEILTGHRPFRGKTSADVSSAILRDTPPPIQTARPDLTPDIERIVSRCLEKDRERRFQTAKDVRNELELARRGPGSGSSSVPGGGPSTTRAVDPPTTDETPSIAVLPFANRSRDADDEYFADGLADELLSVLAKIRGLRVAARTSSASFKGKDVTIAEVGSALNVATVLEGSVRKAGKRVRIAVQLVRVGDGAAMWSETYDRTLDDIFVVQDDIAQSVVKELRTTLLGRDADSRESGEAKADVELAARGRGENAEAHRLYLLGQHCQNQETREGLAHAVEHLGRAVELDPTHALAWSALAIARALRAGWGWVDVSEGYEQARDAVHRALALTPDLAEAHLAHCLIQEHHDWDWAGADASARRALELAPGSERALTMATHNANLRGRHEEAESFARRALEKDPLSSRAHMGLGQVLRLQGRHEEAIASIRRVLELAPGRVVAHLYISLMLSELARYDEALAEAQLEPYEWAKLYGLAVIHHQAGHEAESAEALAELTSRYPTDAAFQIATAHAGRDERDEAFAWLDRSFERRDPGLPQAYTEPLLRRLQGDPRWDAFMRRMGFVD